MARAHAHHPEHDLEYSFKDYEGARVTVLGRRGRLSTTEMYYTLGTRGGVEQWQERHGLGPFIDDETRTALEATGLAVEHDPEGLIGRGLWLGARV